MVGLREGIKEGSFALATAVYIEMLLLLALVVIVFFIFLEIL